MSNMLRNCKFYVACQKIQMSKILNTLTMDEVHKKFNTMRSILRWNMKIIKSVPKHILWSFWRFSVTIICDIKIDQRVCQPHCVKLKFLLASFIVNIFDFLTFDIFWHIHTLPHAPTPCHTSPHPAICHHPCHMSLPLCLPNAHSPCHMHPHPATWTHTVPHAPTPYHMPQHTAMCPHPSPYHMPLALVTCPHQLPHDCTSWQLPSHPATCPQPLPHVPSPCHMSHPSQAICP